MRSLYCNRAEVEVAEGGLKFKNDPTQTGQQVALGKVARTWTLLWITMKALGAEPTGRPSFPYSRPLHLTLRPGVRHSAGDLTFNPNFSDWLMGWPVGWTDPTQPVTGWSPWLQRMRITLSAMPSVERE